MAKKVNIAFGGYAVSPWTVNDLPEEYLQAVRGLIDQTKNYSAVNNQVDEFRRKWEQSHSGYKKR